MPARPSLAATLAPTLAPTLLSLAALACTASAHAALGSTFDSGLDGWTGLGGSVTYDAGGFLQERDTQNTWMSVVAPAAFHGDLSAYLGGTLSFDGLNVSGSASDLTAGPWFGTVTIAGAGGSATRAVAGIAAGQPAPGGGWQSYVATLDAAGWSGNLVGALSQVTSLTVSLEFNNQIVETAGFDNFSLVAAPVPEPGSWALMAAGLAGLAARRPRFSGTDKRR